jgi:hypothetical protein
MVRPLKQIKRIIIKNKDRKSRITKKYRKLTENTLVMKPKGESINRNSLERQPIPWPSQEVKSPLQTSPPFPPIGKKR